MKSFFFSASGDSFVSLERRDLLLDMFGWLGELLRLRVDTGHNHQYIERDLIVFVEAREA
jgi:hypothetical protein